jgi:anthranilate phosphoribosyltransferase
MIDQYIAKIAKGQRTAKDLTWDEAKQAMRALIEGQATPAQVGAFLVGMRFKIESVTELAAFTAAAREYVRPIVLKTDRPVVDLPLYAGKQDTFHASIAAAIIAAAAGAAIFLHGHDSAADRTGVAVVLQALGIPGDLPPARAGESASATGFAYLDLALYHPPLARFLDLRRELGVRTLTHPVAKLLNPARARAQVIAFTHPPYFEKATEALKMLSAERALVLRGVEGDPELSIAGATRVLDMTGERVVPLMLQPRDIGLPAGTFRDMAGFSADQAHQEAALLRKILENHIRGGQRDWVVQNAAMLLYAAGVTPSISAAVPLAGRTLESGAAAQKLAEVAGSRPLSEVGTIR